MLEYIPTSDVDVLGPWAWKRMGSGVWSSVGKSAIGGLDEKGVPIGAVIYDHYEPKGSVQMHIVLSDPRLVTRQAIQGVFEYPFYQLGVKKVIGIVKSTNEAALAFDLRLGFQVETIISDAYDMGSMYILSMTRDQCRWLRGQDHGIKCFRAAAA